MFAHNHAHDAIAKLVKFPAHSSSAVTHALVWCRVEAAGNRRVIDDLLKADMLEVLRANDQLKRERKLGKVFMVSSSRRCLLDMITPLQQSMQAGRHHHMCALHIQ